MTKSGVSPTNDKALLRAGKWLHEIQELRKIVLECQLSEEVKWGWPCYSYQGNNIVLIHGFKEYFALLFFKGSLLHDPDGILIQQTENVQAGRQMRFKSLEEVRKLRPVLQAYIHQAIEVEKAGLKVELKKTSDYAIPEEFQKKLDTMPALKKAFASLTPGRQRAYLFYFAQPKQAKTREARIDKLLPQIFAGKGMND